MAAEINPNTEPDRDIPLTEIPKTIRDLRAQWAQSFTRAEQPDNLALALGAGSTTPLRLAQAYGVLANGGWPVAPVVIERITDAQGKVLFEAPPPGLHDDAGRVVPARNVFLTNSLRFIRPVMALDKQPLRQADLSALVERLCEAARLQCGHDPRLIWKPAAAKPRAKTEGR